jgi:hypothetical protein
MGRVDGPVFGGGKWKMVGKWLENMVVFMG